ncbi:NADH:flavin oxidoreductase [Methylobacterium sp. WL30]|uniref:NADH:flavin oxidoreductase n=1 Tax=unclassified Methylobacterium TaxID=2615210 RepID=UPI0011CAD3BF|nr:MULTISPECIES: NADH:flavin oxidoreductase [unclassified Methylobacterium]TXN40183.1 NADH:flavin oxidoreductase [Methylobacterium sp. WL93]TXN49008.1 NADH:flavin oxidoreductase [Methylobacterium sp. WL119]TXN66407.1 NADH:flavin oxidoreductase [Methylobacterium sp. WL30]
MAADLICEGRAVTGALFEPLTIGGIEIRNRLAVAPMTRISATETGRATRRMGDYYGAFAEGGFGLVITEGVYTDRLWSQGYLRKPGLSDDAQRDAWRPIVERVHAGGARFIAQLMHAGALSQGNRFRVGTRGPSSVRPVGRQMEFYRGTGEYPLPSEMSEAEIGGAVAGFASAAVRAREVGFDGVEIHGANGYLLDQFLTEGVNRRTDAYGGSTANRLRHTLDVAEAVRSAVGRDFIVGLRSSQGKVNDFTCRWRGQEEAVKIYTLLGRQHLDYLHTTEHEAWRPAFDGGPSLAALARRHGGLPVLANGSLHDPARAVELLSEHRADVITLGRGALTHADWPRRVAEGDKLAEFDRRILSPLADLENADRIQAGD